MDEQTVYDWLQENVSECRVGRILGAVVQNTLGPPSQVSLLYFLFFLHAAGGYAAVSNIRGGAQELRIKEGAYAVATALASDLGERLMYSAPVEELIHTSADTIKLKTTCGEVEAEYAIVAVNPADLRSIRFTPELPSHRRQMIQHWPAIAGFKAHAVYEHAFWRKQQLSGHVVSDRLVDECYDDSPPSGSPGVLLLFADPSILPTEAAERRAILVQDLVRLFGPQARELLDYSEMNWSSEQWTAGCVSPLGPGMLTRYGPVLRAPTGRVHWAGTETATQFVGYMEGALRSGKRAAAEVLEAMLK
jgi:monoamine oxidase